MLAVINGALVQIIMVSRVLYGMAKQAAAPKIFAKVHPKTQTPMIASVLVIIAILILALWFPLVRLAETTSFIILIIFSLINLSLVIIKRRGPHPDQAVTYPIVIPIIGFILCSSFIILRVIA